MFNGKQVLMWVILAIIVIGGGWYLLSHNSSTETGPIKIGVIAPLTGDAGAYGEPAVRLYQIAVDTINAAGGVNGRQLALDIQDGKCNGTGAANAAQQLINVDGVQVIIGGFCSGESLAIEPIATKAKVAVLSAASSGPQLTGISPYFARNYPSDSAQGKILADISYNDKGWRNVAFIQEQTDYAVGVYKAFSDEFTQLGGKVTNESFPTATTDFRSIITKVKSENPDAVFLDQQTPAATARILTQIQQLGWKPHLLVSDVNADPANLAQFTTLLEGTLIAEFGVDKTNPKFQEMIAAYAAKYGADLPYPSYAQTEYDAVFLVADAIKAVGYDGTKIANWLHNDVKDWVGAVGAVTIQSNGDPLTGHRPEIIIGGKVVPYTK